MYLSPFKAFFVVVVFYRKKYTQPANRKTVERRVWRMPLPVLWIIPPHWERESTGSWQWGALMVFALLYLPIINRNLTNWRNAWSHHPLRTEKNLRHMQMWIRGIHLTNGSTLDVAEVYVYVLKYPPYKLLYFRCCWGIRICTQIPVHKTVIKTIVMYWVYIFLLWF